MNKLNIAKNEVVHKCIMHLSYDTNQLEYSSNVNWSLHLMAVYVNIKKWRFHVKSNKTWTIT